MITDDLSTLFDAGDPAVRFRQGTVLTWNANTGANTIDLAGGTLTNVPMMNIGEAISLKAGHVVGLLGQGSTWFIIGRITLPGDPNFASASIAFDGVHTSATNFSVTTTHSNKVTSSIAVPGWADEVLVMMTTQISLANSSAGGFYASFEPFIGGVGGGGIGFGLAANASTSFNDLNAGSISFQRVITNPGASIALATTAWVTAGTLPASATSTVILDATAIFRSNV
jgi:hypothetical protein